MQLLLFAAVTILLAFVATNVENPIKFNIGVYKICINASGPVKVISG
jgi:hypothetical protein